MKRILLTALVILSLTTSCKSADTFNLYKDEMSEFLRDPKTRKFKGGENDVNDLRGCQILIKNFWEDGGPDQEWLDGKMHHSTGIVMDPSTKYFKNLSMVTKDKNLYPVYIGPWRTITLTRIEEESFFNKKEIVEQKQIRFFAYTSIGGGEIQYQYESKTEENKNIPEKNFSLPPNAKIAPDKFGLCVVKWTVKYGYNAIAEVKSKNQFSKNYLVPTGRIIDSETGKIIADEKGNLVKND